jgi:hypothetical protein
VNLLASHVGKQTAAFTRLDLPPTLGPPWTLKIRAQQKAVKQKKLRVKGHEAEICISLAAEKKNLEDLPCQRIIWALVSPPAGSERRGVGVRVTVGKRNIARSSNRTLASPLSQTSSAAYCWSSTTGYLRKIHIYSQDVTRT